MKQLLLIALIAIAVRSFGQSIIHPKWNGNDNIFFKSTKLKIVDDKTKRVIFDDFKECSLSINQILNDDKPSINVNIGGYVNIESALTNEFTYKTKDELTFIDYTYKAIGGTVGILSFTYDNVDEKVKKITLYTYIDKKMVTITLTGIEPTISNDEAK